MKSAYVYFYRMIACVKMPYIELECTWIHDCSGASNGMSISKKVDSSCSSGKMCLHN
jgi:hypothetical protein